MAEDSPKSNIEYGGITSLAFDSGGSKLLCVRYDKKLIPVKSARTGSIRVHTNSEETSDERISEILAQVGLSAGDEIDLLCGAIDGAAIEKICGILKVRRVRFDGEMNLGLAAAGIDSDGILAVAGTGTSVFARIGGKRISSGGYGSLIADEGSGYWIAREGYLAAVHDYEGRGPATSLTEIIAKRYGEKNREGFRTAVYNMYTGAGSSAVTEIASLTPTVVKAAAEGDAVSKGILENAGRLIADQTVSFIKRYSFPAELPVAISGSVWRGNPLLYEAFKNRLSGFNADLKIVVPEFEPVVGAVMIGMKEEYGSIGDDAKAFLRDNYGSFSYCIDK